MELAIQAVAENSGKRRYRTVEERRRIVEETLAEGGRSLLWRVGMG